MKSETTADPPGVSVTVPGLIAQLPFWGAPEEVTAIGPLKAAFPASVKVTMLLSP